MKKVLITGANGQLGLELVEVFEAEWEVIATDTHNLDITNREQIEKVFANTKPDLIIHCAAWTDVEGCAENPEKAMFINGEGTKNLAQASKEIGAKLLYISTNEVFDGKKNTAYEETDKPNPINPYAVSKLAGEKFVQEVLEKDGVVVRTSWVYGPKGKSNFPLKIITAADKSGELKVVADEIATPTYAPDLAKAIFDLVRKNPSGIYHLANEGFCSRFEWAIEILKNSGRKNVKVTSIKLKDYVRQSVPPPRSILVNKRARKLGVGLRSWKEALKEHLNT